MRDTRTSKQQGPWNSSPTHLSPPDLRLESVLCRFCAEPLHRTLVDLGSSPLCQTVLEASELNQSEAYYPLHVWLCDSCLLVQLQEYVAPAEIFSEYAYFSSYSDSWLEHARRFVDSVTDRFGLTADSQVVEVASNDGYLLQYFVDHGIPAYGVDPAANVARAAVARGIPTVVRFFSAATARDLVAAGQPADLIVANNVLAHVPDLNDFVAGMQILLRPGGAISIEVPHLMKLIEGVLFDTIYHEHYSYFSFWTLERVFEAHGLRIFDVEELSTHGGSLRLFVRHTEDAPRASRRVVDLRHWEHDAGVNDFAIYVEFKERVEFAKCALLSFLMEAKSEGKTVVGYGAPGKSATLLNYCGIRTDFLQYTVDRNPYKQGKYLPGTHIPVHEPGRIRETRPDYVMILPWNLKDEIMQQNAFISEWGGKFVVPLPEVRVFDPAGRGEEGVR